jgi:hypothetical protein
MAVRAVVLAYPLERDGVMHAPDSRLELPLEDARQLVQEGRARWAPAEETSAAPAVAVVESSPEPAGEPAAKQTNGRTAGEKG